MPFHTIFLEQWCWCSCFVEKNRAFKTSKLHALKYGLVDSSEFIASVVRQATSHKSSGVPGFHCISGFTKLISSTKRDKNLSRWKFLEILRALAASSRICRAVVQGAALMEIGGKKWLPIVTYDFLFELGTVTCAGYLCFPCIVGLVL